MGCYNTRGKSERFEQLQKDALDELFPAMWEKLLLILRHWATKSPTPSNGAIGLTKSSILQYLEIAFL